MASKSSRVLSPPGGGEAASPPRRLPGVRFWAWVAILAQVVFAAAWVVAGFWQGPRY